MNSKLKEAREEAGYTIEEVSGIIKIRKQYIISLEEGDYNSIPGQVYIEGYNKIYHEFLGIPFSNKNDKPVTVIMDTNPSRKDSKKYILFVISIISLLIVGLIFHLMKNDEPHISNEPEQKELPQNKNIEYEINNSGYDIDY